MINEPYPNQDMDENDVYVFPMSFNQKRLWFLHQLETGLTAYHIPLGPLALDGCFDPAAFDHAFKEILTRHESLRTTFGEVDKKPCQIVSPTPTAVLIAVDLRGLSDPERDQCQAELTKRALGDPFDLERGPLVRMALLQLGERRRALLGCFHHMIYDGWSQSLFLGEIGALYQAFANGRCSSLPDLDIQYGDYAQWQEEHLTEEALENQLSFWRRQLAGAALFLDLPTDRPRPPTQSFNGKSLAFSFGDRLSAEVRQRLREAGCTMFTFLRSAFAALLHRYSGQDDVIIGSAVANRNKRELEPVIGFFVNTLAFRLRLGGRPSWRDFLSRTHRTDLEALDNQDLPLNRLVEALQPRRDPSFSPVFQVMFTLQNVGGSRDSSLPGLVLDNLGFEGLTSMFDLSLDMQDSPSGVSGRFEYNTDLFDAETARRAVGHLVSLVDAACEDPDLPVARLPLLSKDERRSLLAEWGADRAEIASAATGETNPAPGVCSVPAYLAAALPEPVDGARLLALDEEGEPTPLLVPGRLHLAAAAPVGVGARKASASLSPEGPVSETWLWPTGDIGRLRGENRVELWGRIDRRLTINGRFIYPEWVERRLETHPLVSQAVVAVRELDGRASLISYIQLREEMDALNPEPTPDGEAAARPLDIEERRRILYDWNDTDADFPLERLYQQAFETCKTRNPQATAAIWRGPDEERASISYGELNQRANQLAWRMRDRGLQVDQVAPILAERGLRFLIAIIAIFKAGGAYASLDPKQPIARLKKILSQAKAPLILAERQFGELATALAGETETVAPLIIEAALEAETRTADPPRRAEADSLAYVIFTSGSTGVPKGAMLSHANLINHLYIMIRELALRPGDGVVQNAPPSFDISVWQFLTPLLAGGRVVIAADELARDPMALLRLAAAEEVAALEMVPSLLTALLDELESQAPDIPALFALRFLVPTGEALPPDLCRRWLRLYPRIPLVNAYGPSECSDDVSFFTVRAPPDEEAVLVPVGRPLGNVRLYVLDRELEPAPPGATGELFIGGVCVGRGYLGDPARTAACFIPNPFARRSERGSRLYRTGDLAYFETPSGGGVRQSGGDIVFLGRVDYQVKIRGNRIELGEIETVLDRCPDVRHRVVIAREDRPGDKRLVAYVVGRRCRSPRELRDELRRELTEALPEYMVPAEVVVLEDMPLTPNGKIDRRNLPQPEALALPLRHQQALRGHLTAVLPEQMIPDLFLTASPGSERQAEPDLALSPAEAAPPAKTAPGNEVERKLTAILEDILNVSSIGLDDDFFESGGHSLLAVAMVGRVRREMGLELPLSAFFRARTAAGMAELLGRQASEKAKALVPIQPEGEGAPFFCVHPLGGNVLVYSKLAGALAPDHPFFGLQSVGLEDPYAILLESVESIAERYLLEIRAAFPQGPYILAGWSSGGMIAMEMARQLKADDGQSAPLILLDAIAPTPPHGVRDNIIENEVDFFASVIRNGAGLEVETPPPGGDETARLNLLLTRTLELAREGDFLPAGATPETALRLLRVFKANHLACENYCPEPYEGRSALFHAVEADAQRSSDLGDDWKPWIAGSFTQVAVPGDHRTMLHSANVQTLADKMRLFFPTPAKTALNLVSHS